MNKPQKTKVEVPRLLKVRLLLRGSPALLPPEPSPAPRKHSRAAKASTLARKELKRCENHLRGARRFARLLKIEFDRSQRQLRAGFDFSMYLISMPRRRYAATRAVLAAKIAEAAADFLVYGETFWQLHAEYVEALEDWQFWEACVPLMKMRVVECENRELRARLRARKT